MKILKVAMALAIASVLASCQMNKQTSGGLIGAAGGGLLGSQIGGGTGKLVAVAVGALAGYLIGGEIGKSLDKADATAARHNTQYTLERVPDYKKGPSWRNPNNKRTYGYTVPTKTFEHKGRYCREYQQTVVINGKEEQAYGTACRQPDGSWQIVSQ